MTLKEQIQKDKISAMKEKNAEKRLVLSTLLGELDRVNKEPSDAQVQQVIKKFVENNKLTNSTDENVFLECYLPELMTGKKLNNKIIAIIFSIEASGMKDMGKVMGKLSKNFAGKYDGKEASDIVKKLLT